MFVTKAILLLYGLLLAFETRNIAFAHLNDSKLIGVCVYNVGVMSAIGVFMNVILDETFYRETFAVMCLTILFPSMVTLCLVFLPKVCNTCVRLAYQSPPCTPLTSEGQEDTAGRRLLVLLMSIETARTGRDW